MSVRSAAAWTLRALFALLWAGGVVSYALLGGPPEGSEWAAPAFLLVAALLVLIEADPRDRVALVLAGFVGLAAEMLGVAFAIPFGRYEYTEVLYPRLLGAPLVMIGAWLVLVAYMREVFRRVTIPAWASAVAAAAWLVAIDLVIDPLAAGPLAYWTWAEPGVYYGIPATNFAGWYLVSLVVFALIGAAGRPSPAARAVGAGIVAFFTLIAFSLGLWIPAAVGMLLLGGDLALARATS